MTTFTGSSNKGIANIVHDLIILGLFAQEYFGSIMALIEIPIQVFKWDDGSSIPHVDMTVEFLTKIQVIGYYMSIV